MNFQKLDYFIQNIDYFGIPNCEIAVTYRHETVYHRASGFTDLEKTRPASFDDIYMLFSATKVLTAVAVMQLVEQGKLSLQDPVKKFFPDYGRFVKTENGIAENTVDCTLEQLMSMQGGLNYDVETPETVPFLKTHPHPTTQALMGELSKRPLDFVPGTSFLYSLCLDMAGAIVEQVSGERFSDYVQNHIAGPLGFLVCAFHPTEELKAHMPQMYARDEKTKKVPGRDYLVPIPKDSNPMYFSKNLDSGGGGVITRVSDYMLFTEALANDGVGRNGVRILTRASIDEMRRNRLDTPKKLRQVGLTMSEYGYGYGIGVRTLLDDRLSLSPIGEFGWDGAAGAYVLADPKNHISITYAMSIMGLRDIKPTVHHRLRDYTYEALQGEIGAQ